MDDPRVNVLWVAGAPGVGKSTVAWALYQLLRGRGERVAYVDVDQLGMAFPEPEGDVGRYLLKHRALTTYAASVDGLVDHLVVSGVTADHQPATLPGASLRIIRLTVPEDVHRDRLAARGLPDETVAEMMADSSHASAASIDNTGRPADVATRLLGEWRRDPGVADTTGPRRPTTTGAAATVAAATGRRAPGSVVWLTGPRCVGTSTVGWSLVAREWGLRRATAYLDLGQLGFVTGDGTAAAAGRAADLWQLFHAAGSTRLVMVGALPEGHDLAGLRSVFEPHRLDVVRLDASAGTLRTRARERRHGGPAELAGDDLVGAPPEVADGIAERAVAASRQAPPAGVPRLSTDDVDPAGLAARIRATTGWQDEPAAAV